MPRKRITKYPLPRPQISLEKSFKILQTLVQKSGGRKNAVDYKEIASSMGIYKGNISQELTFFESIGWIEKIGSGKYQPTDKGKDLAQAISWNDEEKMREILISTLKDTWFYTTTIEYLQNNEKATMNKLISILGQQANARPRTHAAALKKLILLLQRSGAIKISEDGKTITLNEKIVGSTPSAEMPREQCAPDKIAKSTNKLESQNVSMLPRPIAAFVIVVNRNTTEEEIIEQLVKIENAFKKILCRQH